MRAKKKKNRKKLSLTSEKHRHYCTWQMFVYVYIKCYTDVILLLLIFCNFATNRIQMTYLYSQFNLILIIGTGRGSTLHVGNYCGNDLLNELKAYVDFYKQCICSRNVYRKDGCRRTWFNA